MITVGIDSGTKNTKTVIMKDKKIISTNLVLTGFDQDKAATKSLEEAMKLSKVTNIDKICVTGSGKESIKKSDITINEIKAMGIGSIFLFPKGRTVVDVGAEEGRTAKIDKYGNAEDFAINEKCAAGAGAFIEAMGRALEISIDKIGPLALTSNTEIPINAQCAIFAESEVVGLIHSKTSKKDISKAIHDSMASRIISMIRRIGLNEDLILMGGVAYNPAFVSAIKKVLEIEKIYIPNNPEFGMAIGAAITANKI